MDDDFPVRVSSACHDLRTPLASAFGFARTLERLGAVEGEHARYLALVVESTAELGRLIDCLALVARVEDGRVSLSREPVDSAGLVADAIEMVQSARLVGGGEGTTIRVDRPRAVTALAWLAEAILRLAPGDDPVRLDARADGSFALGPIARVMADRFAAGRGDLRAMGALASAEAHGGSLQREDDSLVVRFAVT